MNKSPLYVHVTLIGARTSRQYHSVFNAPKIVRGSAGHFYCSMKAKPLPMQLIQESLEIDISCASGLRWKNRPINHFATIGSWRQMNNRYAGKPACSLHRDKRENRYYVTLSSLRFSAARIVYALYARTDPGCMEVDHIDGNTTNNNPNNLRVATTRENLRNKAPRINNKSGVTGVVWVPRRGKWAASLSSGGKRMLYEYHDKLEDAIEARTKAEVSIFGRFSPSISRSNNKKITKE